MAEVGDAEGNLELDLLRSTVVELESALARVRAAQDTDRQFLADAAHQLRTPIAGVRACAEALLRGCGWEQADRLFTSLVRESSRLTRLEADLRTLARLDDGEQLRPRTADVVGLCKDEISRVWSLAPQLDVVLGAPALSWPAQVDDRAVREILANLLDNARRHAHSRIDVVLTPGRDRIELRVDDDGPGVADEAVEAVFGRFVSLDGLGGSGLGLPIARDLARACGGDLSYRSGGFVLDLPLFGKNI